MEVNLNSPLQQLFIMFKFYYLLLSPLILSVFLYSLCFLVYHSFFAFLCLVLIVHVLRSALLTMYSVFQTKLLFQHYWVNKKNVCMSHYSHFFLLFGIRGLCSGPHLSPTLEPQLQSCFPASSLSSGYVLSFNTGYCPLYWISLHFLKMYYCFVQTILNFLWAPKCLRILTAFHCQQMYKCILWSFS